ncbi:hypothetical protein P153DRAFT_91282 [Dothidotthia symphoricarpi CBS 119687]|uniref:Uncharacterized protein n=1 Tax=Dothidotthia symphoricarpi CBS 119687 TaxID=1392245 RepID=A0A6A6A1G9_9PLEO|nr:uncharacterized protein P153DRAFT_91282 [Dothidotthia symphoricarpi CBS 119687]KAF2125689.1 hypothetical protein P153DRAFT_91282 [Dothidotthia symphoricarpi CBS 119687]
MQIGQSPVASCVAVGRAGMRDGVQPGASGQVVGKVEFQNSVCDVRCAVLRAAVLCSRSDRLIRTSRNHRREATGPVSHSPQCMWPAWVLGACLIGCVAS